MSVKTYDLKDVKITIAGVPVKGWASEEDAVVDAVRSAFRRFRIIGPIEVDRPVDADKEND